MLVSLAARWIRFNFDLFWQNVNPCLEHLSLGLSYTSRYL